MTRGLLVINDNGVTATLYRGERVIIDGPIAWVRKMALQMGYRIYETW